MTISSSKNKISYVPDGVNDTYIYDFRVDNATDMKVYLDDVLMSTGYTVDGIGSPTGGDVIFTAPPVGDTLVLLREVPLTQEVDYVPYDDFPADTHEAALDKLTMEVQQVQEELDRAVIAVPSTPDSVDLTLPTPDASKVIGWNVDADGLVNYENSEAVLGIINVSEYQIATAGQTVFILTEFTYIPGTNNLTVYVNGARQIEGVSYQETDSSTVTFFVGLDAGDYVEFASNDVSSTSSVDAQFVSYTFPTGVPRTVEAKLNEVASVKDFGAVGDGVIDDTAAIRTAIASGKPVFIPKGTYRVLLSASEDSGNDRIFNFNSSSSSYFVGEGYDTVFQLDLGSSFDGPFDGVGLDLREPTGGVFTIGNFRINGDKANKKASQINLLYRFQTGTAVTADYYEVSLLPIWGEDGTGGGCYMGCDVINFDSIIMTDMDEHGAAIRNTSGDGRELHITGNTIKCDNSGALAFDYSGGSQVNGGPCVSNIGSIVGDGNVYGAKIAGNHLGKLGLLKLTNTNLVSQNNLSAFYTNYNFRSFHIDMMHIEDSYNGSISHAYTGDLTIDKLYSRNNNTAGSNNGDIVQSGSSSLTIKDYDAIGHANSTTSLTVVGSRYTYVGPTRIEGFNATAGLSYPIVIITDGVAIIEGGNIDQDNALGTWVMRLDSATSGNIFVNDITFGGSKAGHGPRLQGSGNVYLNNMNVQGFAGNNMEDTGYIGNYSNIVGFILTVTTTELDDITHAVNTSNNKYAGREHFNVTTSKPVYSTGAAAASVWVDATGVTTHTPV